MTRKISLSNAACGWFLGMACLIAGGARAEEMSISLPGHGMLLLSIPAGWQVTPTQRAGGLPPTVQFSAKGGRHFEVLLTPLWSPQGDAGFNTPDQVRRVIAGAAAKAGPQSVEGRITVREIPGSAGKGFYFVATDKQPKPEEFKYMAQGALPLDELMLGFTVLTNEADSPVMQNTFDALKAARHQRAIR